MSSEIYKNPMKVVKKTFPSTSILHEYKIEYLLFLPKEATASLLYAWVYQCPLLDGIKIAQLCVIGQTANGDFPFIQVIGKVFLFEEDLSSMPVCGHGVINRFTYKEMVGGKNFFEVKEDYDFWL